VFSPYCLPVSSLFRSPPTAHGLRRNWSSPLSTWGPRSSKTSRGRTPPSASPRTPRQTRRTRQPRSPPSHPAEQQQQRQQFPRYTSLAPPVPVHPSREQSSPVQSPHHPKPITRSPPLSRRRLTQQSVRPTNQPTPSKGPCAPPRPPRGGGALSRLEPCNANIPVSADFYPNTSAMPVLPPSQHRHGIPFLGGFCRGVRAVRCTRFKDAITSQIEKYTPAPRAAVLSTTTAAGEGRQALVKYTHTPQSPLPHTIKNKFTPQKR